LHRTLPPAKTQLFFLFRSAEEVSLDLGVEHEDESTTGTSEDVGEGSLEEGLATFVSVDLSEAIHSTVVHDIFLSSAGLHHESSSDGIERVRSDTSGDGNELGEGPHGQNVGVLGIREEEGLTSIEHTEVGGSVGDDTSDRDTETSVETGGTILQEHLLEAVNETGELSLSTGTDISGESGTGEIKRVDEAEGSSTGSTTRGAVTDEELAGLGLGVVGIEDLLVGILKAKLRAWVGKYLTTLARLPLQKEAKPCSE